MEPVSLVYAVRILIIDDRRGDLEKKPQQPSAITTKRKRARAHFAPACLPPARFQSTFLLPFGRFFL